MYDGRAPDLERHGCARRRGDHRDGSCSRLLLGLRRRLRCLGWLRLRRRPHPEREQAARRIAHECQAWTRDHHLAQAQLALTQEYFDMLISGDGFRAAA
jgi:hypothetical protein